MEHVSYFLVFLAVAMLAAVAWLTSGRRRGGAADGVIDDALGVPVANLPPVLLPDDATPADVDRIRFSLGLRGYRMDQVDQVLDRLRDQLAARDAEIARLRQLNPAPGTLAKDVLER